MRKRLLFVNSLPERVLCRGEQLLLRFSVEGSRQLKLKRASVAFQGAE